GRAINYVVRRAQKLANQFRLVFIERPLKMRSQKAVHDVHAGGQAEFGHAPQDERLIGGLLRGFAKDEEPTRIERAVTTAMPSMHIQSVFGERTRADFQHHRRALAWRVIILLDAINNALP